MAWESADIDRLREFDRQFLANHCRQCELWYCGAHSPCTIRYEVGGAPMYDYYYESSALRATAAPLSGSSRSGSTRFDSKCDLQRRRGRETPLLGIR